MRSLATVDGVTLAVHELGGAGRPALLCHATGFHGAMWEPFATALGPDLERWAIDFRAHGTSVVPAEQPLEWTEFCTDVLTAVDGLGLPAGQVLGVGHSMGGAALVLAEQARPGTFAGLFLYEPIVSPQRLRTDPADPMANAAVRRRPSFPSHAEALANYASKPPLNQLRADALHAYVRHGLTQGEDGSVHLVCRPADEARVYRNAGGHDAFASLGEVRCPVVVAVGDDASGPVAFAPSVVGALPNGRLERFAHLGHFGPLEAPARVAAAVQAFALGL
ncbi:MAG: alpha/beta hydrolase [Acidimicrobiales bacterium]|nr:alpha/beta hydrolase [Acidimicrobiales bacterium]